MPQWRAFVVMLASEPIDAPNQRDALAVARARFGAEAVVRVQSVASLQAAAAELRPPDRLDTCALRNRLVDLVGQRKSCN